MKKTWWIWGGVVIIGVCLGVLFTPSPSHTKNVLVTEKFYDLSPIDTNSLVFLENKEHLTYIKVRNSRRYFLTFVSIDNPYEVYYDVEVDYSKWSSVNVADTVKFNPLRQSHDQYRNFIR